jgi:ABC-2 type transport system permease protein
MSSFLVLWRRELAGYFLSPVAYATLTFFLAVMGTIFYFLAGIMTSGVAGASVMNLMFGSPFYWMTQMIVVPLLTMRLFAEERRMGTIETLLTAPVSDAQVVAAKFAGVLTFYVLMWLPTLLFFVGLHYFSAHGLPLNPGVLTAAYLGVLLGGAMFLAIGLLCSLMTANQIVAAITCFALLMLVFFAGFIEFIAPYPRAQMLSELISPHRHLLEFSRGIVDTRAVVFYLTGTAFCLFTATRVLESRQWK